MPSSQNEAEALLAISIQWIIPDTQQRSKKSLEKLLQSWFNKNKTGSDCSVMKASGDGKVLIKIKPVPGAV